MLFLPAPVCTGDFAASTFIGTSSGGGRYVGLGERDEAFKWIERVFQEKGRVVDYMRKDFKTLQSDPRWAALASRHGSG